MVQRQRFDPQDVAQSDRQELNPVGAEFADEKCARRQWEHKFPGLHFLQRLPEACHAIWGFECYRDLSPTRVFPFDR